MKPTVNTQTNSLQKANKKVPIMGTMDYYVYARQGKTIAKIFTDGELKQMDVDLLHLIKHTINESGQYSQQLSPQKIEEFLNGIRLECLNYFSHHTLEELRLCFHNGVRSKYGEFRGFNISAVHKWIDGFKSDESRKLAIKLADDEVEKLKQLVIEKKKREPRVKYLIMYNGLSSCLETVYQTALPDKSAWIFYDELRRLKMLKVSKQGWDYIYAAAKEHEIKILNTHRDSNFKKAVADVQADSSVRVEQYAKQLLLLKFIETAVNENYCIMSAFERANLEEFYHLENKELDPVFWKKFIAKTIMASYKEFIETGMLRGVHGTIYAELYKLDLINKHVSGVEKQKALEEARDEQYEKYSAWAEKQPVELTDKQLKKMRDDYTQSSIIKYEAKLKVLKIFFLKVKAENINLESLL